MKKDGFQFRYVFEDKDSYNKYRKKYSRKYKQFSSLIREGGYKIYTSFDADEQENLQRSVDSILNKRSKEKQKMVNICYRERPLPLTTKPDISPLSLADEVQMTSTTGHF